MNDFKTDPISRLKENKGHTSQIKITKQVFNRTDDNFDIFHQCYPILNARITHR